MKTRAPEPALILERQQETASIFTLTLRLINTGKQQAYSFHPGQFNMVYLPAVGEVAISLVSDPDDEMSFRHTIRSVGRVTNGLKLLQPGNRLGIRGPFGTGWPVDLAKGKDILVVTGGLGCAPSVSVIEYILKRRQDYGALTIIQGLKHAEDMIWRKQYDYWAQLADVQVILAADVGNPVWPGHTGRVTEVFDKIKTPLSNTITMMCGPEAMMVAAARKLTDAGQSGRDIYVSMERNMQCGYGHCGHCQFGEKFICRDGPVFCYADIHKLLATRGI